MTDPVSPFELAAAELRALGIVLTRLPGEYRVNLRVPVHRDHGFRSNVITEFGDRDTEQRPRVVSPIPCPRLGHGEGVEGVIAEDVQNPNPARLTLPVSFAQLIRP
jgi:hypothetical protein